MKDILDKAKRSKPATDEAAKKQTEGHEQARHIKGYPQNDSAQSTGNRANRASTQSTRAGIAIQSRYAYRLQRAAIKLPIQEAGEIAIAGNGGEQLHQPAPNQGRCTPNKS